MSRMGCLETDWEIVGTVVIYFSLFRSLENLVATTVTILLRFYYHSMYELDG